MMSVSGDGAEACLHPERGEGDFQIGEGRKSDDLGNGGGADEFESRPIQGIAHRRYG